MSNQATKTVQYVEIERHPGFEIEVNFPHKIYSDELEEIPIIKLSKGYVVKFPNGTKEFIHLLIAHQFLKYQDGDQITFKDGDKFNYNVDNLEIRKPIIKKPGESIDLQDDFLFDDISRTNYGINPDQELVLSDMERTMIFHSNLSYFI